jgi:hypothetical protein
MAHRLLNTDGKLQVLPISLLIHFPHLNIDRCTLQLETGWQNTPHIQIADVTGR